MSNPDRQQLLARALEDLLLPLARLCVAQGLRIQQVDELLKHAFVRAAREQRRAAGAPLTRDVSQVSVATGIHRREVARISQELRPRASQKPSPATQLFSRWIADRRLRGRDGRPRALPRVGKPPSFEALAASVTRHVHPRSLLDELCRLGLAELSDDGQTVQLVQDHFVPQQDDTRLYAFLAANAGDHLAAAADNVIHRDRRHFEQALFTDEISEDGAAQLRDLARVQWLRLVSEVLPALEAVIEDDRRLGRPQTQRARLGLFSYHEPLQEPHDADSTPTPD